MSKFNFKKLVPRVQQAALMGAGSVASNMASTGIAKLLGAKNSPKLNAAVRLAAGVALPMFLGSSKKDNFITHFADGVLAESAVSLAKAFGVPGISGADDGMGGYEVSGPDDDGHVGYQDGAVSGTES